MRLFKKNLSLRIVNLVGLSVVFACMLLSAGYIRREMSYDRHNANVDRIVRMTMQFNNEPVDGRLYGNTIDPILQQIPEIERTVKIHHVLTAVLTCQGKHRVVNDFYAVSSDFLNVFDITLLHGHVGARLAPAQMLISESLARQLFDNIDNDEFLTSEIKIDGRRVSGNYFISGIYKDMPETSHFRSDILLYLPDDYEVFAYTYLLLQKHTDIRALAQKITTLVEEKELFLNQSANTRVLLTSLADIHLRSRNLREMSVNGNIYYIYLIIGANVLLLTVVLFNLWLNASLIFSRNRRYYQILRLHGAPSSAVFKDEALSALFLGVLSMSAGILAAFYVLSFGKMTVQITFFATGALCLIFLSLIIAISLLPALKGIASTLFLNTGNDLRPIRFSYSNVKYMLTTQYAVVMIVVILAFGINKQMNLVRDTQVGGNERNILVMGDQPYQVQDNYAILKTELLKHTEIEAVTSSFQLPGDAIRDAVGVRKEGETDWIRLPIIIAGEDFLPFFRIPMIAGREFSPNKYDQQTEYKIFLERWNDQKLSEHVEEYVVNRKALAVLGFATPEEAIGEILWMQGSIDYFRSGIIVGVTDDFNYTGLYEETQPLLILQRSMFSHCFMVRLDPGRFVQARAVFEKVWNEVNPDFPADYAFMSDVFGRMYRSEMNAQRLVYIFSLLCLAVANLGLIIFMTYLIRRRTKEIGIRKVYGASVSDVLRMLNMDFIRYIALAFVIAVPVSWYVMQRWLERFAYRTSLDWWIFVLAGLGVLLISVVSVSMQSWRAATANPVKAIKSE